MSNFNTLFEKSNFCPKIQFWQDPNIFMSFSPNYFWQFFSWNQSCQQLKSPIPKHFHEFFTPKKSTIFSGNQSWIFGQKFDFSNSVIRRGAKWTKTNVRFFKIHPPWPKSHLASRLLMANFEVLRGKAWKINFVPESRLL